MSFLVSFPKTELLFGEGKGEMMEIALGQAHYIVLSLVARAVTRE